ncbi:MAG: RodZ domain-containing protein [Pseudomonas sp.]
MNTAHPEMLATTRTNPGETLRTAREAKHWSLPDVAEQLNLPVARLEQVEAGDFDKLPGHTFARGYIRAYAKLLGIDQSRLVLEFDQYTGTDAVGSRVQSLGHIEEPMRLSHNILRGVSFVLLVLLAGAGFYWWQQQAEKHAIEPVSSGIEQIDIDGADGTTLSPPLAELEDQAVAAAQGSEAPGQAEALAESAQGPQITSPGTEVTDTSVLPQPVEPAPVNTPVVTPALPPAAESPSTAPVVAAAGEGVVRLQFTANCWTQLTDATGKVLLRGLKRSGDSLELKGKAPLELRLGFARGAQVSYNGQAVDVLPFITGETARLKLGQ